MNEYEQIGVELLTPYTRAKNKHKFKCLICAYEWQATPLSIKQTNKKRGVNGCPDCNNNKAQQRNDLSRQNNIQKIQNKGLHILSNWNGQVGIGKESQHIYVKLYNPKCGHTFETTAKNLITRNQTCTVCGIAERTRNINNWSTTNSKAKLPSREPFSRYKKDVNTLTRQNYKKFKHIINPNNLPTGRCGEEDKYQIDHYVPIRWCFDHYVPVAIVGAVNNLQMLPWRLNVQLKNKLKGELPDEFKPFNREF